MKPLVIRSKHPGLRSLGLYQIGEWYYDSREGAVAFYTPAEAAARFLDLTENFPKMEWELLPAPHPTKDTPQALLGRCPRLLAHLICHSLGYATPRLASIILADAHARRGNSCEWIYSQYGCNPLPAVQQAIRGRRHHHGYMADYRQARAIVAEAQTGNHPTFASWF